MGMSIGRNLFAAALTIGLLASPAALASSNLFQSQQLANSLTQQFDSVKRDKVRTVVVWKFLLDMGARANGTKVEGSGKHQAWCSKYTRSYDPASNTFEGFGGKRIACISPYG